MTSRSVFGPVRRRASTALVNSRWFCRELRYICVCYPDISRDGIAFPTPKGGESGVPVRVVVSGSPEARRKGLDNRVEISFVVKGPYWPSKIISGKYR